MKIEIDEDELAAVLNTWFNQLNVNNPNVWNRNKVAKVLKNRLKSLKHWKDKDGRTTKTKRFALEMMKYKQAVNNGYDGPPPNKDNI